ncbi:MAG: hypothetical protein U9R14_03360 [Patescibacteria group bacterium]|nr:hypothetical protein [Patescibacteria group bacterium]
MKKILKISGIVLGSLAVIFGIVIYLSFFTNFWLHYPNPFKTQTALSLLEMSVLSDPICHETCFAERELYKDVISDYALKNKDIKEQIKNLILDQEVFVNFQEELIQVLRLIAEKEKQQNQTDKIIIPEFLFSYLNSADGRGSVQQEIMSEFGDAQDNRLLKNLYSIACDYNINEEERSEAINTIGNTGNEISVEFLMGLVEDERNSYRIRYETANKLPVLIGSKKIQVTKDWADRAVKIALDKNIDHYIAERILDVAYYYDTEDKNYVIKLMQKVYYSDVNKFIRDRSTDILHGLGEEQYKNPEITDEEWEEHHTPFW